jgi:uncharacterized protein
MLKKNAPLTYILLALGLTWLLWIPALVSGYPLPTIDYLLRERSFKFQDVRHVLTVISFTMAVYGPLLAALAAAYLEGGRQRVGEWFAPVLRWRVGLRWYGVVLLIALSMVLLPLAAGALAGLVTLRPAAAFPGLGLILGMLLYQLLTSGFGEEPGWRGYLLPRWQKDLGPEKAVWLAGLVWSVWHFPFTIYHTLQAAPDLSLPAQLSMLVPALLGQTMALIGMTYIYAWLLKGTGSVFLALVFHGLGNTVNAVANAFVEANPLIGLAIAAMPWLVVLVIEQAAKPLPSRLPGL